MFGLAAGLYQSYFSPTQLNILLIGEEDVGKTALLERIKVTQFAHKREVIWTERLALPRNNNKSQQQQDNDNDGGRHNENKKKKKNNMKHHQAPKQQQSSGTAATTSAVGLNRPSHDATIVSMRRSLVHRIACPAPPRYQQAAAMQDDEYEYEDGDDDEEEDDDACDSTQATESTLNSTAATPALPSFPPPPQQHPISDRRISQESMESIDMNGGNEDESQHQEQRTSISGAAADATNASSSAGSEVRQEERMDLVMMQYDMKPNVKMLPLEKIRPTSGMNLAKVEVCGCKCHVWDLCGRFQSLWERYYSDCDAVIFVVQVQDILPQQQRQNRSRNNNNNNNNNNQRNSNTSTNNNMHQPSSSSTTLERVRSSIADDVPFLILGHVKPPESSFNDVIKPDVMYSTESLLPHYHNPMTAMFMANAANGQGVKSAMEWLVPLAKRQKPLRDPNNNIPSDNDGINK